MRKKLRNARRQGIYMKGALLFTPTQSWSADAAPHPEQRKRSSHHYNASGAHTVCMVM